MPDDKDFELDDLDTFSFDDVPLEGADSELKESDSGDEFGVWVKSAPEDVTDGLPDLDDLQDLGELETSETTPDLQDLPEMSDLPDMEALPDMESLPEMDSLPDMDNLPEMENLPEMDNLPSMEAATDFDDLPDMSLEDDDLPSTPAPADSLPEEDFLSSEELASLDDQFDFVTVSEEPLEGEASPDDDGELAPPARASEAPSAPGDFDDIPVDDFVTFDDTELEDVPGTASSPVVGDQAPVNSDDDFNEEFLDIDIDINDDVDDEELEILEGAQPHKETPKAVTESFVSEEVDMSEFGDFSEVTEFDEQPATPPVTVSVPAPVHADIGGETEAEFDPDADLAAAAAELESEPLEQFEDFEVDLDAGALTLDAAGDFEETILDESLNPDDETDLDHIMALEENLTSGIRESDGPTATPVSASTASASGPANDMAALILSKIEQELSSIKKEISDLKKDFTVYRDNAPILSRAEDSFPSASAEVPEPQSDPVATEKIKKGFFDEEEDETIALTGDELDNILSSAEISEEDEGGEEFEEDLIVTDAEGNLPPVDEAPVHVTDEEFFAGTSLEESEASIFTSEAEEPEDSTEELSLEGGVPESIELVEEEFPEGLDEDMTVDLLSGDGGDFEPELTSEPDLTTAAELTSVPDLASEAVISVEEDSSVSEVDTSEPQIVASSFEDEMELEGSAPERLEIPFDEELDEEPPVHETDEDAFSMPVADYQAEESGPVEEVAATAAVPSPPPVPASAVPESLKDELKAVLAYMDKLLVSLPDDKIQEFAESEHFEVYKKLFEELGLKE